MRYNTLNYCTVINYCYVSSVIIRCKTCRIITESTIFYVRQGCNFSQDNCNARGVYFTRALCVTYTRDNASRRPGRAAMITDSSREQGGVDRLHSRRIFHPDEIIADSCAGDVILHACDMRRASKNHRNLLSKHDGEDDDDDDDDGSVPRVIAPR